ncbi:MAG TPA: hypothetical protein VFV71_04365 [Burkholderiales bacterium]|nr:hypothetical protein [Burkholderiales bacterium]
MVTLGSTPIDIVLDDAVPDISATQKIRLEQESLKPAGLVAGAYYRGYLGSVQTVGRWNGQQYRFVVWVQERGASKLKGARHVLESGIGDAFAPFEQVQVEKEKQISDFDLNTTR